MSNSEDSLLQFDYEWREGDRTKAKEIAKDYINSRRSELTEIFSKYSLDDLVRECEALRIAGRVKDRIIVDMWLMSEYEPQNITGVLNIGSADVAIAAAEAIIRGEK